MDTSPDADISQILEKLASDDKSTRRGVLTDLKKKTIGKEASCQFPELFEPLIKILSNDKVDSFRESAATILLALVSSANLNALQFKTLVQLAEAQIAFEPSEEVRLVLAKIVHSAVINQTIQQVFLDNLDDLTKVLKLLVADRYGEVVKEACEVIIALAEINDSFRLQADYFVEPLLHNIKTHSMKTRIPCVKALEPVMVYAPLTISTVTPQLEKSWFESSPSLKLAMVRTIGNVSLEIELDDQNFHFLPSMILLGRCNDFSEVSEVADDIWKLLKDRRGNQADRKLI